MRSDLDAIRERQALREAREEAQSREHWGWASLFHRLTKAEREKRLATADELRYLEVVAEAASLRPGTPEGGF